MSAGGSSGGSNSHAGPGEGKDVVELTEANFRKKVLNSEKVRITTIYLDFSRLESGVHVPIVCIFFLFWRPNICERLWRIFCT